MGGNFLALWPVLLVRSPQINLKKLLVGLLWVNMQGKDESWRQGAGTSATLPISLAH